MNDNITGLFKSKEDIENITNILALSGKLEPLKLARGYAYVAEIEPQVVLIHIPDDIPTAEISHESYGLLLEHRLSQKPIKYFYITGLGSVTQLNELYYQLNAIFETQNGTTFDFSYANVENLVSIRIPNMTGRRIIFGDAVVHDGFRIWCWYASDLYIQHPKVNGHVGLKATAEGIDKKEHSACDSTLDLSNIEIEDEEIVEIFGRVRRGLEGKALNVICPSNKIIQFSTGGISIKR